jgi:hypothetical protein
MGLFGAATGRLEPIGALLNPEIRADADRFEAGARAGLGEETFARAWAEGQAMTLGQAVEYALRNGEGGVRRRAQSGR